MNRHRPTDAEYSELVPAAWTPLSRTAYQTRAALALAACAALLAGGFVAVGALFDPDEGDRRPVAEPTGDATTRATPSGGVLHVSGTGVGGQPFGTDVDDVVAAVTARFGEPDSSVGPRRYVRSPDGDAWQQDAGDPLSPSWRYPVASETCWRTLCLTFGGARADALQLRGWELVRFRGSPGGAPVGLARPDVRLAGTGVRLGDRWERLHAAYPRTTVAGAEGASVSVRSLPWPAISDGAGEWRLSGTWHPARPTVAPAGAVVTRLSAGEGPEPGCC